MAGSEVLNRAVGRWDNRVGFLAARRVMIEMELNGDGM